MTRLDALNMCLRAASLSPVASLVAAGDPQVSRALTVLDETSEEIQSAGWSTNTDFEAPFPIDAEGKVPLPANTLNISAEDYNDNIRRVSVRIDSTTKLKYAWNVKDRTFVFESPLTVNIIYLYDFDDLTPELQRYIAAKAAFNYASEVKGAGTVAKLWAGRVQDAYTALVDAEAEIEDANVLTDSPFCVLIASRNNESFG